MRSPADERRNSDENTAPLAVSETGQCSLSELCQHTSVLGLSAHCCSAPRDTCSAWPALLRLDL